jgi:hypothetical protein
MIARKEQWVIEHREQTDEEKKRGPVYHHALVAWVNTDNPQRPVVTTVNGNAWRQGIELRPEPITNYLGFYDSLSETDGDKYEKQIRQEFGWAVKAREQAGLPGVSR